MELVPLIGILIVVVAVLVHLVRRDLQRHHQEQLVALLLTRFGSAIARAEPQDLRGWQDVVHTARQLYPEAFARVEATTGERFPFSPKLVETALARWTADWLAWEHQHHLDFELRVSALEVELERRGEDASSTGRARRAAIEEERLRTYQQRYEEYVRVANGLKAFEE